MRFVCKVGTPNGAVVEEIHEGGSVAAMRSELERKGYHVFAVRPRFSGFGLRLPSFEGGRVKDRDFLIFNQELVALLRAGLPLLESLGMMLQRGRKGRFKELLKEVRDGVEDGESLSEAFGRYSSFFPPLYAASLKAGERSGEIEQVIRRFTRYHQLLIGARRKVISALVYPAVLMVLSVVMIAVMSLYVIPQFREFFATLDIELPALTRAVLATTQFARSNLLLILAAVICVGLVTSHWAQSPRGRLAIDRFLLRLPLAGGIVHRFALSQFTRSLATLLEGGTPLVPSLEIAVNAVGNTWVRSRLSPLAGRVSEGNSFHDSLEESGVFTDLGIGMIEVGESTGALDHMLEEVSLFFEQEAETRLERLLTLFEPVMLAVMGAVVATLLVAMYLPMFSAWGEIG